MPADSGPALSPEQWSGRDYRQSARELDTWAKQKPERRPEDDATEYVAKLGLSYDDCVIVLNRAHDCVLVRTWRPYGGPLSSSPGTKRERLFAAWPIASRLFCHRRLPNPRGDK